MSSKTYRIKEALDRLVEDPWRKQNSFSDDMRIMQETFFAPFVSDKVRAEALANWLQSWQPCLFGRIAAKVSRMHYCFLDEANLRESDQDIAERIATSILDWKRRSLDPSRSQPAHGFMLCAISPELSHAAPDSNLKAFADAIHDLLGCTIEDGLTKETLYLRNPKNGTYVRFSFTVDYFGAQGDKRWWHDHRVPGGIAFTANSAGHMIRFREWYENKQKQIEFLVQAAMLTIAEAADVGFGPATKLIAQSADGPVVNAPCPFSNPAGMKAAIQGKDWSRYSGWHNSDHCVRAEFFTPGPDVPDDLKSNAGWYQDFGYLYDKQNPEYLRFIEGEPCTQEEVDEKLGPRDRWKTNFEPLTKRAPRFDSISEEERLAHEHIARLLEQTRAWTLTSDALNELLRVDE
jgi:hypothetical protein